MTAFEPAGEFSRWRIIYGILHQREVGDLVGYPELAKALDLHPKRQRHLIQAAVRRAGVELEKVDKHAIEALPNEGYRILPEPEHMRLARRHQRKSNKSLVRGHSKVTNVDLSNVEPEVRQAFQVVAAAFSMQMEFNRRTDIRQQKLEKALESVREKSTRTDAEVAELRERLERLEQR